MKHIKTTICFLVILIAGLAQATVRNVPQEYPTIQAAINACNDFDTVIVAPGRYFGSSNRSINLNGKSITVRSINPADPQIVNNTIIDCEGKGRGFVFYMAENTGSKVTGLTITNGYGLLGGAIYCYNNSSPLITNCVFINNSAIFGGAIACTNSNTRPKITNCTITANSALVGGGGIYCNGASPRIANSIITGNSATIGGAIYSHNAGDPLITNCTISENFASISAGGIYCYKSSNMTVTNTILWGNVAASAAEILVGNSGAATSIQLSYCDICSPDKNIVYDSSSSVNWGPGNIDVDPHFVKAVSISAVKVDTDSTVGDYHLLEGSPCIDNGDPDFAPAPGETDIDGNPRLSGKKIDIGADEFEFAIPADVKITPRTLNLTSSGNWINCDISLGDGYDISDVNTADITLNNKQVEPVQAKINEEAQKLLVKFDRSEVQSIILAANESAVSFTFTIAGNLNGGQNFKGVDTIRLVRSSGKK